MMARVSKKMTISFMIVLIMVLQQSTSSAAGVASSKVGSPIMEIVDNTLSKGQERQFGKQIINDQLNTQINASTKKELKKQTVELEQVLKSDWYQNMMVDVEEKPNVQVPESEQFEPYYYSLLYFDAFNKGFRFDEFWSNTSECYYRMTNYTYIQEPLWRDTLANSSYTGYDKVDNTTALISNTSESLYFCVNMTRSWWEFMLEEQLDFEYSWTNWFAGFFQNLLTQVISMNNIYTSISDNQAIKNQTGVWYDTGRLLRVLLIFDPIEPVEVYYNANVNVGKGYENPDGESDYWLNKVKKYAMKLMGNGFDKISKNMNINKIPTNKYIFDDSFSNGGDTPTFEITSGSLWEMTKGALNSTGVTYGGNRTGCEEAAVDVESGVEQANELFRKDWYEFLNVLDAADQVLLVGSNLNGITFDCYYGIEESYYIMGNYTDVYHDPDILMFNALYNAGEVYDSMMMMYTYFNYPDLSTVTDYWDFGYEIGEIIHDLAYPTEELILEDGADADINDSEDPEDE